MIRLLILRFTESYFSHRWLYLLPILLLSAAGIGYIIFAEPEYLSKGTMYVRRESLLSSLTQLRDDGYVWSTAASVTTTDLYELSRTEAFVRAVLSETVLRDQLNDPVIAAELITWYRETLAVSALGENLVEFGFKSESPELAQQLALATVNVYKSSKLNIAQQESIVAQTFFADVIKPYQAELDEAQKALTNYLAEYPDPVRGDRPLAEQIQIQQYQSTINSLTQRLQSALEKEESARLSLTQAQSDVDQTYSIVDSPNLPTEPETSIRQLALLIIISFGGGVALSLAGIAGGALLDRSFRLAGDVSQELQLPVLAMIEDSAVINQRRERAERKAQKRNKKSGADQAQALQAESQSARPAGVVVASVGEELENAAPATSEDSLESASSSTSSRAHRKAARQQTNSGAKQDVAEQDERPGQNAGVISPAASEHVGAQ